MFRFFRAPQRLLRLPIKNTHGYPLQIAWQHSRSTDQTQFANALIEKAKNDYLDDNLAEIHHSLDQLAEMSEYRAAALIEKGKISLLQGDLLTAKLNFNKAVTAKPESTEARRLYLQTSFAIGGSPEFLANSKITPLSSFSQQSLDIDYIDEEAVTHKPK